MYLTAMEDQPVDQYVQRRRFNVAEAEHYVIERLSEIGEDDRELGLSETIGEFRSNKYTRCE